MIPTVLRCGWALEKERGERFLLKARLLPEEFVIEAKNRVFQQYRSEAEIQTETSSQSAG
jgi:hypothetical protein